MSLYEKVKRRCLSQLENKLVSHAQPNQHPPIFITGSCRSGTTLVFQYLVHHFQTSYFPNVARQCSMWPYLATRFDCDRTPPSKTFESRYGDIQGKCAPSDGWQIFHKWFSYFMNPGETRFDRLRYAPQLIGLFERFYNNDPFLNKNNSNTLRIIELQYIFQNALFIHVTRNITATVLSVLRGREENGIMPDQFWSVAPEKSLISFDFHDELELVVFQYLFCNQYVQIANDKLQLGIIFVDYDEFCPAPSKLSSALATKFLGVSGNPLVTRGPHDPNLRFGVRGTPDPELTRKIKNIESKISDQVNQLAHNLCEQAISLCK